jgi:chromosome segregation ATPase
MNICILGCSDLLSSVKKHRHLGREYVHLEDEYNTQRKDIENLVAELEEKNTETILLHEKDEVLTSTNRVLMEQVDELETRLEEKEIARRQLQSKVRRLQDLLCERDRMYAINRFVMSSLHTRVETH